MNIDDAIDNTVRTIEALRGMRPITETGKVELSNALQLLYLALASLELAEKSEKKAG